MLFYFILEVRKTERVVTSVTVDDVMVLVPGPTKGHLAVLPG